MVILRGAQKAQVSDPQRATEPFSYPNDLSFKRYYAAVEEAFVPPAVADDADDDHLFAQEDNDEVCRLFGNYRLFDLLEGTSFVDRPERWMTESELYPATRGSGTTRSDRIGAPAVCGGRIPEGDQPAGPRDRDWPLHEVGRQEA